MVGCRRMGTASQRALYRQCSAALRGYGSVSESAEAACRPHDEPSVESWAALMHTFVDGLAAQMVDTPSEMTVDAVRTLLRTFLRAVAEAQR